MNTALVSILLCTAFSTDNLNLAIIIFLFFEVKYADEDQRKNCRY